MSIGAPVDLRDHVAARRDTAGPGSARSPLPASTPASSAGPSSTTSWTHAPWSMPEVEALGELRVDGGGRDAEVRVADLAVLA